MSPKSKPVPVAGTCTAGHHSELDAQVDKYGRPRLTWRGTCPTEGCDSPLIARRIKHQPKTSSASPKQESATPTATTTPRRAVRKVTAYRDAPTRPKPKRARAADGEPANTATTAPVPAVAKPKPAEPKLEPDLGQPAPQPRARRFPRLSFGGPDVRDDDGWTVPGIY